MRLLATLSTPRGVLLWVGGLAVIALVGCSREASVAEPVRAVRTMQVSPAADRAVGEFAAEIRPRIESRLGFRVAGKLVRRKVNLGDTVKRGQVLAELDPTDLRLAEQSARATLSSAQVNLEQAKADYKRFKDLQQQGFISAADLERRDTTLRAAQAQWEQARAQVGVQVNQAGYAALKADAAGVITGVDAEPGMVLGAGSSVVRLAHDGPRDVVFNVPEDQIERVRGWLGQPDALKVRLWGEAGTTLLSAAVREVAAATDPVTRTFQVKADLGRADVRLGQTATVLADISRSATTAGVRVPTQAIWAQNGRSMVWVLEGASMKVRAQPVTLSGAVEAQSIVGQGLQPGQEIVTAGVHVLTEGQTVRRWSASAAGASVPAASVAAPAAASR